MINTIRKCTWVIVFAGFVTVFLYLHNMELEGSDKQKEIFYTALYHSLVTPDDISDAYGSYRVADNKVHKSKCGAYFSTLSLWDTFRDTNPIYVLLYTDTTGKIVESMIEHFDVTGFLPIWPLCGHETHTMIGNLAIPIIVDAYLKGIRGYDADKAYMAVITTSTVNHPKSDWDDYLKYGYLPFDIVKEEAVSRTLESGIDDWCVAQMAKAAYRKLGKAKECEEAWKKLKDYTNRGKETGFFSKFGGGDQNEYASSYYLLGLAALSSRNKYEAISDFRKFLENDSYYYWAKLSLNRSGKLN